MAVLFDRPVFVVDRFVHRILPPAWAKTRLARMIRDRDADLAHVVGVVRLAERVAQPGRCIEESAGIRCTGHIPRVYLDADDVIARRDNGLPIGPVQHKVLAAQPLLVLIRLTDAGSLGPPYRRRIAPRAPTARAG